jgi:hypothetical protein
MALLGVILLAVAVEWLKGGLKLAHETGRSHGSAD